jgi:hypothetical protein
MHGQFPHVHRDGDHRYRALGKRVRSEHRRLESDVHVFTRVRDGTKRSADHVGQRHATADSHGGWGHGPRSRHLRFRFPRLDAPGKPFPRALITVPGGWSRFRGFGVDSLSGPRYHFVSFWDVVDVYANSCHWLGPKVHPGPTVDELAAVLAARPLRNATVPAAVSLGGYDGKYLEWSIPNGIVFTDCDKDPGDGQSYFESFTGNVLWNAPFDPAGTGDRYEQGPGQVDRLWILDVEGRRLVIDASYLLGATAQDKADVQQVVDSIRFEP